MSKDDIKQYRIDNLKQVQATRKEDSFNRVMKAIDDLQKRNEKINFHTVASVANVSVAYLYKYTEIKQRIAEIRNKQSSIPRQELKPATSTSQIKIESRLKERIKQLEKENKDLRCKNEALAGQVYRIHQFQEQVERQLLIIDDLKNQLLEYSSYDSKSEQKVTPRTKKRSQKSIDNDKIDLELKALKIRMNTTLLKLIKDAPEEVVLNAISSLKEALSKNEVKNKAGFLAQAIRNKWSPNENYEEKVEISLFNEWFPLAKSKRLVLASTKIEGVLHLLTEDGEWISFEEMINRYPLDELKIRK